MTDPAEMTARMHLDQLGVVMDEVSLIADQRPYDEAHEHYHAMVSVLAAARTGLAEETQKHFELIESTREDLLKAAGQELGRTPEPPV